MPESVCTIVVAAATGSTYRATSMARFSACLSTFWTRRGCESFPTCQMSPRISPRFGMQYLGQLAVVIPRARDGVLVDCALGSAKSRPRGRDVRDGAIEAHVTLALLLRVIKRMRVQK